jgi:phosphonate metabolism protein PhnN/1,5-bisphosphokinase (PRPP-forming)
MGGMLVLVVGPSGVGKDALLAGARRKLADDPRFVFCRRVITRPRGVGEIEAYEEVDPRGFARLARDGQFVLSWHAHGYDYALPASLLDDLAHGQAVVANVSHAVVGEALRRFPSVQVIEVAAPAETCAARLIARGRESKAEIAERLSHIPPPLPPGVKRVIVDNSGSLEAGIERFVRALEKSVRG